MRTSKHDNPHSRTIVSERIAEHVRSIPMPMSAHYGGRSFPTRIFALKLKRRGCETRVVIATVSDELIECSEVRDAMIKVAESTHAVPARELTKQHLITGSVVVISFLAMHCIPQAKQEIVWVVGILAGVYGVRTIVSPLLSRKTPRSDDRSEV